jgi:predicted ATPase
MISAIRLDNFKAFRSLDLTLAGLTLLTGLNAAGKSTTLQALALLRQSHEAGSLTDEGLLLNGDLVTLGVGQDVLHEDFSTGDDGTPQIGISLRIDGLDSFWRIRYDVAGHREAGLLPLTLSLGNYTNDGLFGTKFQYLRADRIVPAVSYEKSYDSAVRKGSLGARGEHTVNFLRVNQDAVVLPALHHPEARTSNLLDEVEAWMQELCPGVNLEAEDLRGTDSVRLSYGFFGRSGISSSNNRYRPTNVGFGLTYVLPVVVACLTAGPHSLLLLENPEAHLHPRGQMMMAELAARAVQAGAQVVVETHSDHVLNGTRLMVKDSVLAGSDVAVHYFRRDRSSGESGVRIPAITVSSPTVGNDGMLSMWPPGFFDEWDKALDRLLD